MQIYINYASIDGHNLELAEFLQAQFDKTNSVSLGSCSPQTLTKLKPGNLLILVPATYGSGEIAAPGLTMYQALSKWQGQDVYFWVLGIGDQGYCDDFCQAVLTFDQALAQTGARRLQSPLLLDYELDQANEELVCQQLNHLKEVLANE